MGEAILPEQPTIKVDTSSGVKEARQPQVQAPAVSEKSDSQPAVKPAAGSGPSRTQRIAIGVGTGAVALAGLGAAALGIELGAGDNPSSIPAVPSGPEQIFPGSEKINVAPFTEKTAILDSKNVVSVDMTKINPFYIDSRNGNAFLVPLMFEPGDKKVKYELSSTQADGKDVGSFMSFSGLGEGSVIKSTFNGSIVVSEIDLKNGTKYKSAVLSQTNSRGETVSLQFLVPDDAIPGFTPGVESVPVKAGEKVFTMGKTTELPGGLGHSLEVVAHKDDGSGAKFTDINLMSSNGRVVSVK